MAPMSARTRIVRSAQLRFTRSRVDNRLAAGTYVDPCRTSVLERKRVMKRAFLNQNLAFLPCQEVIFVAESATVDELHTFATQRIIVETLQISTAFPNCALLFTTICTCEYVLILRLLMVLFRASVPPNTRKRSLMHFMQRFPCKFR